LIVQPEEGIKPLIEAINSARESIQIAIFRFDYREIAVALKAAIVRGVAVNALIAHTNHKGARQLRNLEMQLLADGVTVTRTATDLLRYHYKLMIIDRRVLYLLAFNYTRQNIARCRSFAVITRCSEYVEEAVRLFEADATRQPYVPRQESLVISPLNARRQLAAFIQGARAQLLIYDNQLKDRQMIDLLGERVQAGVEVRIIGRLGKRKGRLSAYNMQGMRLHTRTIIRDGRAAFIGSQSLRRIELDSRRELGLIIKQQKIVGRLMATFEQDWQMSAGGEAGRGVGDQKERAAIAGASESVERPADREAQILQASDW
jgi:phosphatidylserine/phosphatidylglycerophosphate/cardiolipin synthase-like enzyme